MKVTTTMGELPSAAGKKRYGNRRFMGKPHQPRVSKNPLHYTSKIERLQRCAGPCEKLLDKSAFVRPTGEQVVECPECLRDRLGRGS